MESKYALTTRKRKRIEWWSKHKPKEEKVQRKSDHTEKPLKEIPAKEDPVQNESNNTLENEETQNKRYILFIGNIPFTVKEEDVKSHFRCTGKELADNPFNQSECKANTYSPCQAWKNTCKLMTKKTGESKGCGFIEFNNKKSFLKALNLHHSVLGGRKINVEVTCGGGGKGKKREKRLEERKTRFRQGRKRKSRTKKVKSKEADNSATNKADKIKLELTTA